jgi:hypothetical protein
MPTPGANARNRPDNGHGGGRNDREPIREFKNGRQLAAFLGLVPKQHSSGGKERLQGIGKLGLPSAKTIRAIGNSHNQRPDVSSQSLSCFCQALNACTRAASM